jgi:hypothetical protein
MATSIDTSYADQPISAADIYRAKLEKRAFLEKDGKPAEDPADPLAKEDKAYRVTISEEALKKAGLLKEIPKTPDSKDSGSDKDSAEIEELKRQDREVRAHEQAHVMAGGSLVRGAANFSYKSGPDGILYAVGGEVSIDSAPVDGDPQATIRKMEQVQKAALAPAQPSGQDRAVAAAAMNTEMDARRQLTSKKAI